MMTTLEFVTNWIKARYTDSDRGASLVEYALLVALIAVVCIGAIGILGDNANSAFSEVGGSIGEATG